MGDSDSRAGCHYHGGRGLEKLTTQIKIFADFIEMASYAGMEPFKRSWKKTAS